MFGFEKIIRKEKKNVKNLFRNHFQKRFLVFKSKKHNIFRKIIF